MELLHQGNSLQGLLAVTDSRLQARNGADSQLETCGTGLEGEEGEEEGGRRGLNTALHLRQSAQKALPLTGALGRMLDWSRSLRPFSPLLLLIGRLGLTPHSSSQGFNSSLVGAQGLFLKAWNNSDLAESNLQ